MASKDGFCHFQGKRSYLRPISPQYWVNLIWERLAANLLGQLLAAVAAGAAGSRRRESGPLWW